MGVAANDGTAGTSILGSRQIKVGHNLETKLKVQHV